MGAEPDELLLDAMVDQPWEIDYIRECLKAKRAETEWRAKMAAASHT